jgi:hypothetical protein
MALTTTGFAGDWKYDGPLSLMCLLMGKGAGYWVGMSFLPTPLKTKNPPLQRVIVYQENPASSLSTLYLKSPTSHIIHRTSYITHLSAYLLHHRKSSGFTLVGVSLPLMMVLLLSAMA